jgi:hypothetical protein
MKVAPKAAAYLCIAAFTMLSGCNNDFGVLTKKDLQYLPIAKCAIFEPTVSCDTPAPGTGVCGHQPLIFTDSNHRETYWQVSLDNQNWVEVVSGITRFSDIPGFAAVPCDTDFTFYMKGEELCNSIEVSVHKHGVTLSLTAPAPLAGVCGHNTITFTDSDTFESSHEVSVDGTNWHAATSGMTRFSDIPEFVSGVGCDSTFTLYVRGQDTCNHAEVSLVKKNITITITAPASGDAVCGHNTVTFTDSDSLETGHQASIDDNTTWVPFTSNSTTLSAVPGFSDVSCGSGFTLHLRGGDGCNVTDISFVKKSVTLSITSPAPAAHVCAGQTITFTDSDTLETNHQVSVNGTDWVSATSGVTTYSDITGFNGVVIPFTLYIRGTTAIDNCNHAEVNNVTKAIPTVSITSPAPGANLFGDETISFTDPGPATSHQASIDQISWSGNLTSGSSVVDDIPGFDGVTAGANFTIYLRGNDNTTCNLASVSVVKAGAGAFADSRTIVLNTLAGGANVSGNVSNFPVLIRMTDAAIIGAVRTGAPDVRFYYSAGSKWLDYQIERWDQAGNKAEVWVLFPLVHGSSNTDQFTMYFGNATIADGQDPDSVFSTTNGFVGVWHMSEDPSSGTIYDSTGNHLNGTTHGMVAGDRVLLGQVGYGLNFYETPTPNNWISLGTSTLLQPSNITVSCWMQAPISWDAGISWVPLFAKAGEWYTNGWEMDINFNSDGTYATSFVVDGSNPTGYFFAYDQDPDLFYPVGTWVYTAITFRTDPGSGNVDTGGIYRNGTNLTPAISYHPEANRITATTTEKKIGEAYGAFWPGRMDELRISNVVRSADWIKLCYENQKTSQSLVTISP